MNVAALLQLAIAMFGVSAIVMAMSNDAIARRFAPIVGLAGQPFWIAFSLANDAWGLLVLCIFYTGAYCLGLEQQWQVYARIFGRPLRAPSAGLVQAEKLAATWRLALEIAQEASVSDVERHCKPIRIGSVTWYDLRSIHDDDDDESDPFIVATVRRAVEFLDMRRRLIRHPNLTHSLVRFDK